MRIKGIEKLTNTKFLNMFKILYEKNNKNFEYYFVSRRKEKELSINNTDDVAIDSVEILPYYVENNIVKVVLIKEFRVCLNRYIYSLPAGLVEKNENFIESSKREVLEEIGAKIKKIDKVAGGYVSAGLTDETTACFEAEIYKLGKQHLEENEDISIKIIELDKLEKFIKTHTFSLKSALMLKNFIYKKKLENLEKERNF